MPLSYFPAILHPADADGLYGVTVPGAHVNASGSSAAEALSDAVAILQEVVDDLAQSAEGVPQPVPVEVIDPGEGRVVLLPVSLPERSVRVNVSLPADLVARIDAASGNRSAFLARWALHGLRTEAR